MAKPMTPTQLKAQLKKWGIKYVEVKSWETHNRNVAGPWSDLRGFIWHHTGADTSNPAGYAASILYNGLSNLPGPLCHFGLAPDGTVYLVGWGRANHAGGGDPVVLEKVTSESYTGQLKPTKGNSNGVGGNGYFYGVEIMYSGSHKMTDAQYKTALKLSAAICEFHGWTEKSCIAHGEWSSDKWDPGYASGKIMNMVEVRDDIKATIKAGATPVTTPPPPPPTPTPTPVDKPDVKTDLYKQVWDLDAATPPAGRATTTNPTWTPMSILKHLADTVDRLEKKVTELEKKLGA